MDRLLAIALLLVHFGILLFLFFGGFLARKRPRVLYAHVPLVLWAIISSVYALPCPVTAAENFFRGRAGMALYEAGFIETHLAGVLYPANHVNWARLATILIVLTSWAFAFRVVARVRARMRVTTPFTPPMAPPRTPVRETT